VNKLRLLVDRGNKQLSISRQCELLELSRSAFYYRPSAESDENLQYMRLMDEQYLKTPFYGVERMCAFLRSLNYDVNIKRVRRLLRLMGIEAIYCKPNLSKPNKEHKIYPYLLRGLKIDRPDQVWSTDITYIPMKRGFMYLVAVIDWYSRRVLSWRISNSLENGFCIDALNDALKNGKPEIFNTDQGSQFTSKDFTGVLEKNGIKISMDGKGRALDNVFIERLWRSVKYEDIFLHSYENGAELYSGLQKYFEFYNKERLHSSLDWQVPDEIYFNNKSSKMLVAS
jgi:putative transposase